MLRAKSSSIIGLTISLGVLPSVALGASAWSGPPCDLGAAHLAICSSEPTAAGVSQPCFVSKNPDVFPNLVERDLVRVCQAAKIAIAQPNSALQPAIVEVEAALLELTHDARSDRADALDNLDSMKALQADMTRLGQWLTLAAASSTPTVIEHIRENLADVANDAAVWTEAP